MDYTYTLYRTDEPKIRKAIAEAKTFNLEVLPVDQKSMIMDHFSKSLLALDQIKVAEKKKVILDEYSKSYSELHNDVRKIQIQTNDINKKIIEIEKDIERSKDENKKNNLKKERDYQNNEKQKILANIPREFEEKNKQYKELFKDYKNSLNIYYQNVDQGYENFCKIFKEIKDVDNIKLVQDELRIAVEFIQKENKDKALKSYLEILKILDKTSVGDDIKNIVYEVTVKMKKDWDKSNLSSKSQEIKMLLEKELLIKDKAGKELLVKFENYNKEIVDTIGVRKQERIPRKHALYVSKCIANHQDISLNF